MSNHFQEAVKQAEVKVESHAQQFAKGLSQKVHDEMRKVIRHGEPRPAQHKSFDERVLDFKTGDLYARENPAVPVVLYGRGGGKGGDSVKVPEILNIPPIRPEQLRPAEIQQSPTDKDTRWQVRRSDGNRIVEVTDADGRKHAIEYDKVTGAPERITNTSADGKHVEMIERRSDGRWHVSADGQERPTTFKYVDVNQRTGDIKLINGKNESTTLCANGSTIDRDSENRITKTVTANGLELKYVWKEGEYRHPDTVIVTTPDRKSVILQRRADYTLGPAYDAISNGQPANSSDVKLGMFTPGKTVNDVLVDQSNGDLCAYTVSLNPLQGRNNYAYKMHTDGSVDYTTSYYGTDTASYHQNRTGEVDRTN